MFTESLKLAVSAVREAALVTTRLQRGEVETIKKRDLSPVTLADVAAQIVVAHRLKSSGLPIMGEEGIESARTLMDSLLELLRPTHPELDEEEIAHLLKRPAQGSARFWTLDPIDGTKGFLRDANYAIALALLEEGTVKLGVLGCPRLSLSNFEGEGVVAAAELGGGSWVSPLDSPERWEPLRCSSESETSGVRLLCSVEAAHTNHGKTDSLLSRLGSTRPRVGLDSQAKYVKLAAGEAELLLRLPNPKTPDYREKIWDHAAGKIVLEEAGGQLTDIHGTRLDFSMGSTLARNLGILATNGKVHDATLKALSQS